MTQSIAYNFQNYQPPTTSTQADLIKQRQQAYKGKLGPVSDHPDPLVSPILLGNRWSVQVIYDHPELANTNTSPSLVETVGGEVVPVRSFCGFDEPAPEHEVVVVAERVGRVYDGGAFSKKGVYYAIPVLRELCLDNGTRTGCVYVSGEHFNYGNQGFVKIDLNTWVDDSSDSQSMSFGKARTTPLIECSIQ